MFLSKTPYRISLFGGGSDHRQWFSQNDGHVVSFTINRFCRIVGRHSDQKSSTRFKLMLSEYQGCNQISEIKHPAVRAALSRFGENRGFEISHFGDLPSRSGIGSSSTFCVGLINLLCSTNGNLLNPKELANYAIHLEQVLLSENVGIQDQVAASYGGINHIEMKHGGWKVNPIQLSFELKSELARRSVLVYTGIERSSSDISAGLIQNIGSKFHYMDRLVEIAVKSTQLLASSTNLDFIADLLLESWSLKKKVNPLASISKLDSLIDLGMCSGAKAAKVLGAGGGGFVLFWLDGNEGARQDFIDKFGNERIVSFNVFESGSQVTAI
jgi:D-glycero-alpha-D-manno-heptose-7-phosphate kinase